MRLRGLSAAVVFVLLLPALVPYDPMQTDPIQAYMPPSQQHLLGTDQLGRDVLSRAVHGGRNSLLLAAGATGMALAIGIPLGVWLGIAGARWYSMVRIVISTTDALRSLPSLVLTITIITILTNTSQSLLLALAATQTSHITEWVRARTKHNSTLQHIESAKSFGAGEFHIIRYHLLPRLSNELLQYTIIQLQIMLVSGTALTFIGFGNTLGQPEWGSMMREGRDAFRIAPWIALTPGLAITAINFLLQRLSEHDAYQ